MIDSKYQVVPYVEEKAAAWDKFVLQQSVNGTFLQTRRFLNYHPIGRFSDASLMIMQGPNIVAVIPACEVENFGEKCFYSHKGSTFGGIVISKNKYDIATLEQIVPLMERFLLRNDYKEIVLKITSDIFSRQRQDMLEYFLFKEGYSSYDELSFYIDCSKIADEVSQSWSASRRRDYRYSLKNQLKFRRLESDEEIYTFYSILCDNLSKHNTRPVHTVDELLDFKNNRLQDEVDFYGVFYNDVMVAGTMLFYFEKNVLHTQYLAQDFSYSNLYTMNYMNHELIKKARDEKYSYFSFGISTEQQGRVLNRNLAMFKEGFGTECCINRVFSKNMRTGINEKY